MFFNESAIEEEINVTQINSKFSGQDSKAITGAINLFETLHRDFMTKFFVQKQYLQSDISQGEK
jgi:hypothetical protein